MLIRLFRSFAGAVGKGGIINFHHQYPLEGCSRFLLHWELRTAMTELDVEIVLQRARERYPGTCPRMITLSPFPPNFPVRLLLSPGIQRKMHDMQNCYYQTHITINNRTSSHLKLAKADLQWGEFNLSPVADIPPKTELKAFVAQASVSPAGIEGTVVYNFQDDANLSLSIYFDIPTSPWKSNAVAAQTSNPDISASVEGFKGKGAGEACTIKLIDGR